MLLFVTIMCAALYDFKLTVGNSKNNTVLFVYADAPITGKVIFKRLSLARTVISVLLKDD